MSPRYRLSALVIATAVTYSTTSSSLALHPTLVASAPVIEARGACLITEFGKVKGIGSFLRTVCDGRNALLGSSGMTVKSLYSWVVSDMASSLNDLERLPCTSTVRCNRLRGFRLVLFADSLPIAFEDPQVDAVDVFVSTGLVDISYAIILTYVQDVAERIGSFWAEPADYEGVGFSDWLDSLVAGGGRKCGDVPKYPFSFLPDSESIYRDMFDGLNELVLTHELEHARSDNAMCGSSDGDRVEIACDSIALTVLARQKTSPLVPVLLYTAMAQLEALFAPVYQELTSQVPSAPTVLGHWHDRAIQMMHLWRSRLNTRGDSNYSAFAYVDTILSKPLPAHCRPGPRASRLVWGAPLLSPDTSLGILTPQAARHRLERMGLAYDIQGFRSALSNAWDHSVRLYLAAQMDPNAEDGGIPIWFNVLPPCQGPLTLGCSSLSSRLSTLDHLLAAGANVNTAFTNGTTSIMYATALRADSAVLQALIAHGAAVNATDSSGNTALLYSAYWGVLPVVTKLVASGADVDQLGSIDGISPTTALVYAASQGHTAIVKSLLEGGANVNATGPLRRTVLMAAVQSGDSTSVKLLITHGAAPNAHDVVGETALAIARRLGYSRIATLLLAAGAKEQH